MSEEQRPEIVLTVDGQHFSGWESIEISRSLEQCAGTFRLSVSDRTTQRGGLCQIPIGAACRVTVDDIPVVTGYVDDVESVFEPTAHTYTVTGRDKTCDLVDCCPPSTQIKGASLPDLARRWGALFGIEVVVEAECNRPAPNFKSDEGSTCFEMLEKLARANAVMLTSDGEGRLVITRASKERAFTGLKLGGNLLRLSMRASMKDRFSVITVKGQSGGSEGWNGKANAQAKGVAKDPNIKRYRPLTLVSEQEECGNASTRAKHEVAIRYGKGYTVEAIVNGWYSGFDLWTPNRLVDIIAPNDVVLATWLVVGVVWRMDSRGWLSELSVAPEEAYDLIPQAPKGKKGNPKASVKWPGAPA